MKLLGHLTPQMTLRYVEVTNEDLGEAYLKAAAKARQKYSSLKLFHTDDGQAIAQGPQETIDTAFDELVARIQAVRFDHPNPEKRKKLQRLVERLRRAQGELPRLLER